MRTVLRIGLGPFAPPTTGFSRDQIAGLIKEDIARTKELGFESHVFEFNPAKPEIYLESLSRILESRRWDAIAVGFGFRGSRESSLAFEMTMNLCKDLAPQARLLFNQTPGEVSVAVARNFPDDDWPRSLVKWVKRFRTNRRPTGTLSRSRTN